MAPQHSPLRLNVGFIAHQPVGFKRDFHIEIQQLQLGPDLALENFNLNLTVSRTYQGLLADARIAAIARMECVRCLDEFGQPLQASFTELFPFSNKTLSESGLLYPESGIIDFGPMVREYLTLEIPINPVCRPDCLGLCPICGENRNLRDCEHDNHDIDERFSPLGTLKED
jgi:DUF177 domain-containing protein